MGGGGNTSGGSTTAGTSDGTDGGAGNSGVAGKPPNGGSGGSDTGGSIGMGGDPAMAGAGGDVGDAGDGPVAGSGGTAGTAGGGGSGGTSGSGGSAGTAGSGGTGGSTTATGCAKLSVPLDAISEKAHFVISLAANTNMGAAGAPTTIKVRYYVQAGTGGYIFPYVQDVDFKFMGMPQVTWTDVTTSSAWSTITWNVTTASAGSSGINKASIRRIGIELNAGPIDADWESPSVVYIDSITVDTPAMSITFDDTATVNPTPLNADQSNQVMWLNDGDSDTTATGTGLALSWQAKCP
jgi:hypothetical protein